MNATNATANNMTLDQIAEAQAEFKKQFRAKRAKGAQATTIVEEVTPVAETTTEAEVECQVPSALDMIRAAKMQIASFVSSLLVAAGLSYAGFSATVQLALLVSASSFLSYMVLFIGAALTVWFSMYSAGIVAKYIASGKVVEHMDVAHRWIGNVFKRKQIAA